MVGRKTRMEAGTMFRNPHLVSTLRVVGEVTAAEVSEQILAVVVHQPLAAGVAAPVMKAVVVGVHACPVRAAGPVVAAAGGGVEEDSGAAAASAAELRDFTPANKQPKPMEAYDV